MRVPAAPCEDGSRPAGECCLCGSELYRGEVCYVVNGEVICPDCLADYARQTFAPFRRLAGEGGSVRC